MQWFVQERELANASISTSIGLLEALQRLLRLSQSDPARTTCTDADIASVLDHVKEHLGAALCATAQPA